jgi:hypothetical protein
MLCRFGAAPEHTSLVPFLNPSVTTTPPSDAAPEDLTSKAIALRVPRLEAQYCVINFDSRELRLDRSHCRECTAREALR